MKKIIIIGGKWKNYKLYVYNDYNLRPTIHIIKKKLFNWINPILKNSKCLDCFAGSGSLGIEALSRYSKLVIFIEKNFKLFKRLKKNLTLFKYNKYIINSNVIKWLKKKSLIRFNIVFLDPPFYKNLLNKTIYLLEKNKYLSTKTIIYIESEKNYIIKIPKNWYIKKFKIIGNILIRLYLRLNK
ncbi:MAG: 16S rRNA (guanine(966)-N(2))-methyltransferase RsmD [Enterobacteriaceae bacterium PSpyr]|nr:MAG: 16S rRNA (guanine(966)-N(2))-methyltransferase RsmD [Enterobacteriaceae bacterium PSpyr]